MILVNHPHYPHSLFGEVNPRHFILWMNRVLVAMTGKKDWSWSSIISFAALILGGLGLAWGVYSHLDNKISGLDTNFGNSLETIRKDIGELNSNDAEFKATLNGIRDLVKSIDRRIAEIQLKEPIETAVVTTRPTNINGKTWVGGIHFFKTGTKSPKSHFFKLNGPNDTRYADTVKMFVGGDLGVGVTAVSFDRFEMGWADKTGTSVKVSPFVFSDSSFVYIGNQVKHEALEKLFKQKYPLQIELVWGAEYKSLTWPAFMEDVESQEKKYLYPPKSKITWFDAYPPSK